MTANDERIHAIVYSCDSREELAERIVALEELCADMRQYFERSLVMSFVERVSAIDDIEDRMNELGIEVD